MRLDIWLTEHGLFDSRSRARQAIEAGWVRVNGQIVVRPAYTVGEADRVEADTQALRYVSRGGYKLEKAIRVFGLDFQGKTVLDVGASTGGFTDCALQHGAEHVVAVDVGIGQLHPSLAGNPRVRSMENTDIRTLSPAVAGAPFDWIVVDASFISLRHILPVLPAFLSPEGGIVALVKPQFELDRRQRLKGGIVRDARIHRTVLEHVRSYAADCKLAVTDIVETDLDAPRKNQEFLLLLTPQ